MFKFVFMLKYTYCSSLHRHVINSFSCYRLVQYGRERHGPTVIIVQGGQNSDNNNNNNNNNNNSGSNIISMISSSSG